MRLPIRIRLTLAFALAMAVVLAGLGAFLYWRLGQDLLASVDLSLRGRAQIVVAAVQDEDPAAIESVGSLIDADESFAQILDGSGRVLQASSPALEAPIVPSSALSGLAGPQFRVMEIPRIDADPVRLLVVPVDSSGQQRYAVVGATLGDRRDALTRLLIALAVAGPAALALTSWIGWMVAGAALRPVEAMRREASAISVSEPHRRLSVPATGDELARLGATLNSMLDRMQEAFERERRFVDDASHELRTPLSILKMELDLALARSRTPAELEGALQSASVEADRLARLAEDLLVLARAEGGHLPLHRTEIDLPEVLGQIVGAYGARAGATGARAGATGVRIELDVEDRMARVDPIRLRQAVENLLDNAVRVSVPGGVVRLRAVRSADGVAVSVEDSGPGFPSDFLEHAFEPFARPESGASGNGAGAGLGLAIVRAVAEAHGGTARAENRTGGGARVTIALRG